MGTGLLNLCVCNTGVLNENDKKLLTIQLQSDIEVAEVKYCSFILPLFFHYK